MMNAFAGAFRITRYQLVGRQRRLFTMLILFAPAGLALVLSLLGRAHEDALYTGFVYSLYLNIVLPFWMVYWGSAIVSDEIEGKTLVFFVTRPVHRAVAFLQKFASLAFFFAVLLVPSVLMIYLAVFAPHGRFSVIVNFPMVLWDLRAMFLGGLAYAALAYLFASFFKKPLVAAIVFLFAWDSAAALLPGSLKQFTIRHYIFVLGSHRNLGGPSGNFWKFLSAGVETTEMQALITLPLIALVLVGLASALLTQKEFLGDDPLRAQ